MPLIKLAKYLRINLLQILVELNRDKRFMCVLYCNNHKFLRIISNKMFDIFLLTNGGEE
jgi:hypothetical protein